MNSLSLSVFFFFFNDTATTEIYTLSLHDALPISSACPDAQKRVPPCAPAFAPAIFGSLIRPCTVRCICCLRSEEHTSELQSHLNLVCRLLLEKKKKLSVPQHLCTTVLVMTTMHSR